MYSIASIALLGSAVAHIVASVLGQFSGPAMLLAPLGIVYALCAVGLFRQQRWSAWLSFLILTLGLTLALNALDSHHLPNALVYAMAALNAITLLSLFVVLWRHGHKK